MAILTQGTQIYMLVPDDDDATYEVVEVGCATDFNPGSDTTDRIDVTCLSAGTAAFMDGLTTPGEGSLSLNADPKDESHLTMYELSKSKKTIKWAVGFSDGKNVEPEHTSGNTWELPATRTWFEFEGSISAFPFDFTGNAVVSTAVSINRTGASDWTPKT